MDNEKEVMKYFQSELASLSTQQKEAILKEVDDIIAQAEEEYKENAKKHNELHFEREKEMLDREQARRMAELNTIKKSSIANARKQMEDIIFNAVKKRLISFCESDAYADQIKKVMLKADQKNDHVLHLNQRDMQRFAKDIQGCNKLTFVVDEQINIGGYILVDEKNKTVIDKSYDALLEEERTYFYEHSHLLIDK